VTREQDLSLQIVACPGIFREVETVHHSIVDNLHRQPDLKLTDIAVLATDMSRYRPAIQAVFDRPPQPVTYNLADYSAAELSIFGHAVMDMLDLALESFSRSRVFAVLLNPCFLARLGVDREQALVWLEWAEALGIYHGWDQHDKHERGYPATPLYCWQLGLQRLRLGRLMEVVDESADQTATRFQGVIPFADLNSSDREQLDAFCRAVEGLLPRLARLRRLVAGGSRWADELERLIDNCLDIPADRPSENQVRDVLGEALQTLSRLDGVTSSPVPLALIREFVQEELESRKALSGEFLTGGVTISALPPVLPLPFRIIYVMGLDESLFPGSASLPPLDLRSRERLGGDIRPAETNRRLFLEALLAARDKVYLLYNCRELQKDQVLYPSSPINQLRRFLERHVLAGKEFKVAEVPLLGSDRRFLEGTVAGGATDVLVNYSLPERLLAIEEARRDGVVQLDERRAKAFQQRLQAARRVFQLPAQVSAGPEDAPTISLTELRRFLRCPADAALLRHLHLTDDEESEPADDEPFYTGAPDHYRLLQQALERFVIRAVTDTLATALKEWRQRFAELHEEWRWRSRGPEEAFAAADLARLEHMVYERIEGPGELAAFLRERQEAQFCGPVLLGESPAPVGARQRFPALTIVPAAGIAGQPVPPAVRLVGTLPLAWRSAEALDILVLTSSKANKIPTEQLCLPLLEPLLFYLALKADNGADGSSAREWLGERMLRIHIAHAEGRVICTYAPDEFAPDQARTYLAHLGRDFLDRGSFDLLPFDLIIDKDLRGAYFPANDKAFQDFFADAQGAIPEKIVTISDCPSLPDDAEFRPVLDRARAMYVQRLEEAVADDQENEYPAYRMTRLLEMVEARVPEDSFDKVRRRFWLLDRPLARARTGGEN
jgi:hypothetical protein